MSFEGKVILITGASSGIGAACAEYFAKDGALLALVGRNVEKFESLIERIKDKGVETEPLVILADVTVDAEGIIDETIKKYDRLDILINCAGLGILGTIETTKMEDFDLIMTTNVRAVLQLTQLAVPHLIESKGNVVNVSSVCGMRPFENFLSYCMSKAALNQFSDCVAMELASKGVRVNTVNPAFIDTDFHCRDGVEKDGDAYMEIVEKSSRTHPLGRVGQTDDCVNAIVFLAKDSSNFLTGVILPVDGGKTKKSPDL